jgi:hypothetical protein
MDPPQTFHQLGHLQFDVYLPPSHPPKRKKKIWIKKSRNMSVWFSKMVLVQHFWQAGKKAQQSQHLLLLIA